MLKLKYRAITKWPGEENPEPRSSPFRSSYEDTKNLLEYELDRLDYVESSLIVEMWVRPQEVFVDGSNLKAGAKMQKPGIILRLVRKSNKHPHPEKPGWEQYTPQQLSYPCDAFISWKENLRAIALSLEALRKVERYGVFKYDDIVSRLALPSAEGSVGTVEAAMAFISKHSGVPAAALVSREVIDFVYKKAARKLHPDVGGNTDEFLKLQEAKKVLEGNQ